jgi:hypothetical protein
MAIQKFRNIPGTEGLLVYGGYWEAGGGLSSVFAPPAY